MANTSNSNYVNISNLPQTQQAVDTDLVILQTENGTQTITFENLNVVKTDAVGNATILGSMTGNDGYFTYLSASQSVDSAQYYANGVEGYTALDGFYNRFTLNNGLVTSATYTARSDDDYNYITQTFVPSMSAWQNGLYARTVDKLAYGIVNPNMESITLTIAGFFSDYPQLENQIKPWHINVTFSDLFSAFPFVPAGEIVNNGGNLDFNVYFFTRYYKNIANNIYARVLVTYSVTPNGSWVVGPTPVP